TLTLSTLAARDAKRPATKPGSRQDGTFPGRHAVQGRREGSGKARELRGIETRRLPKQRRDTVQDGCQDALSTPAGTAPTTTAPREAGRTRSQERNYGAAEVSPSQRIADPRRPERHPAATGGPEEYEA